MTHIVLSAALVFTVAATTATAAGQQSIPAPPPASFTITMPAFSVASVLQPTVVAPLLDDLQKMYPVSPAVKTMLDAARAGRIAVDAGIKPTAAGDQAAVLFVRALVALGANRIADARDLFQQVLRAAPRFVGVAVYLGSCHAAMRQDREAIGAWQMSLLSASASSVYPPLVDALLRVGEARKALEFISESPPDWGYFGDRRRREAIAFALTGQLAEVVTLVDQLLGPAGADAELLFLGLEALYRLHFAGTFTGGHRDQFREWVKRYEDIGGTQVELAAAWKKVILE